MSTHLRALEKYNLRIELTIFRFLRVKLKIANLSLRTLFISNPLIVFLFLPIFLPAQKDRYFSFELAGSGGLASVNYEKTFLEQNKADFYYRLGFSFVPVDRNNGTAFIFPLMLHTKIGQGKHLLDIGLGQTLSITSKGSFFIRMPASFGYRLEPIDKKHYWRLSYTPIISYLLDFQWEHWGGLTFGYKIGAS